MKKFFVFFCFSEEIIGCRSSRGSGHGLLGGADDVGGGEDECDEDEEHREFEILPVLVLLCELVGRLCALLLRGNVCSLLRVVARPDRVVAVDGVQVAVVQVGEDIPGDEG